MIYSPTSTREWIRCPYRAHLLHEGWRAPVDWDHEPVKWIGIAVHAGLAYYFNPDTEPPARRWDVDLARMAAEKVLEDLHQDPPRLLMWDFDRCLALTFKAMKAVLETRYGQLRPEQIVGVETTLGGVGRKDMVYRVPSGLRVVDWKVRKRMPKEMSTWDHDWQVWHYAWEVNEVHHVDQVEVVVIVLEPKVQVVIHEVPITLEKLNRWEYAAREVWNTRDWYHETQPYQLWTGCDVPYYPCEFKSHCHEGASLEAFYRKEEDKRAIPLDAH